MDIVVIDPQYSGSIQVMTISGWTGAILYNSCKSTGGKQATLFHLPGRRPPLRIIIPGMGNYQKRINFRLFPKTHNS
jgi:hypothetical protein